MRQRGRVPFRRSEPLRLTRGLRKHYRKLLTQRNGRQEVERQLAMFGLGTLEADATGRVRFVRRYGK